MSLPSEIVVLSNAALASMRATPTHHLDWRLRQGLYLALETYPEPLVRQARGRLAVLAAQYVLPIFTRAFPTRTLPHDLITTAIAILDNTIAPVEARRIEDHGYHAIGNGLGYDTEQGILLHNADTAAFATYKAIVEARGWRDPFARAASFAKAPVIVGIGNTLAAGEWRTGDQWADEDWAQTAGAGDTAAAAAVAFACTEASTACRPEHLRNFWEWWIQTALPLAWEIAHQHVQA